MKKILLIAVAMCYGTVSLIAQEAKGIELSGLILSTDQTAVAYATVVAKYSKPPKISGTISDIDGYFKLQVPLVPDSIFVKCLGFTEKKMAFGEMGDTIFMEPRTSVLGEVVVKGERPTIQMRGSTLQVNVTGTTLAKESNLTDLLRKIPGLIANENGISTVEGFAPSFYVNGRKISSMSEIKNMDVKSIKSIDLDTSPGARYGSTEKAVVNIKTTSFLEGTSLVGHTFLRANKRFTHDNSLDFSIKNKALRVFGGVAYSDYRRRSFQDITTELNKGETAISTKLDGVGHSEKEVDYSLGTEYSTDDDWEVGFKYNGSWSVQDLRTLSETVARLSSTSDRISGDNLVKDKALTHHLNGYVHKDWSDKLISDLFLDFYLKNSDRAQQVSEHSSVTGDNFSKFDNGSSFSMLSVKPVFEYQITPKISSEFGGEFLRITGKSDRRTNGLKNSEYDTTETTWAGFGSLKTKIKGVNLQIGLRYENVQGRLENKIDPAQSLNPVSSNLFGDISASTYLGNTVHSVSLKNSVERPKFGLLNNYSYYSDHYSSQLGNPELKPAISFQVQYKFLYKFLYLALSYTNTKDYIGNYFFTRPENPNQLLATWVNYRHNERFQGVVNLSYSFGFYHPVLTSSIIFEKLRDERLNALKSLPLIYVDFNNNFDLPWNLNLNVEYQYRSNATSQIFTFSPVHIVNIGLGKSFLDGAIDVTLKCRDLFAGEIDKYHGSIGNIRFSQIDNQDRRSVSLDFTWRFNKTKDRYKGQSQNETINRL